MYPRAHGTCIHIMMHYRYLTKDGACSHSLVQKIKTSQIVVGTLGTVLRWIKKGHLKLKHVTALGVEEADMMFEVNVLAQRCCTDPAAAMLTSVHQQQQCSCVLLASYS